MNETEATDAMGRVLKELKLKAEAVSCHIAGPLHRYTIRPEGAISFTEHKTKAIARAMRATSLPVITENFGEGTVSIQMMCGEHPAVDFEEILKKVPTDHKMQLPVVLGAVDVEKVLVRDLAAMPHLLLAGTTGSGKSMQLHAIIHSLTSPLNKDNVKLVLMDPKMVEFSRYDAPAYASQLAYDVSSTLEDCVSVIRDLDKRMRERLEKIAKAGCKDIQEFRARGGSMKYLVVVIDELADLVRAKKTDFAKLLCSLAEKSRAAGIHIVAATQHPSHDVVSGPIKANFPARIACRVATRTHSGVILDAGGAENLTGKGDALLIDGELQLVRFKGALVNLTSKEPLKPLIVQEQPVVAQSRLSKILGAFKK